MLFGKDTRVVSSNIAFDRIIEVPYTAGKNCKSNSLPRAN